jgi:hypothetical protein
LAVVFILVVVLVAFVYLLSIHSMPFTSVEDESIAGGESPRKQPYSILFKIFLSHFQVIEAVPFKDLEMPEWMQIFFSTSKSASGFNPNLSFVACGIAGEPRLECGYRLFLRRFL